MKLIDLDALIKQMEAYTEQIEEPITKALFYTTIRNIKWFVEYEMNTLEKQNISQELKIGEWINDGCAFDGGLEWMHCSVCNHKDVNLPITRTNFCPNCGAKMSPF